MIPVGHIVHQIPRRVRVRIAEKQGDSAYFESLVAGLSQYPAIEEVTASPLAGSVTIRHSGPFEAVAHAAAGHGLFQIVRSKDGEAPEPKPTRGGPGLAKKVATGLTGLSLLQATRGPVFGSAAENFWHAYGSTRILGRPDLAMAFGAIGVFELLSGNLFGSASSLFFYALVLRRLAALEQEQESNGSCGRRSLTGCRGGRCRNAVERSRAGVTKPSSRCHHSFVRPRNCVSSSNSLAISASAALGSADAGKERRLCGSPDAAPDQVQDPGAPGTTCLFRGNPVSPLRAPQCGCRQDQSWRRERRDPLSSRVRSRLHSPIPGPCPRRGRGAGEFCGPEVRS